MARMRWTKEQTKWGNPDNPTSCAIRTNSYDKGLKHIVGLYEEAKQDFPSLRPEDVTLAHYGGKSIRGIMGIQFKVPEGSKVPRSYTKVSSFEDTLS